MIAFLAVAGCFALGLVHLMHLAAPPRTDLAAGVGLWDLERARSSRPRPVVEGRSTSPLSKVARRISEELTRRSRDLVALNQDFAITESTLEGHVSRLVVLVVIALIGPSVILASLVAMGLALPLALGPMLGVALAVGLVAVTHREIRAQATSRRAEFRQSLSTYLDLVAMSLEAGRGHAEALPASANICTGWAFVHVQDAIDGARFSGVTPWKSLGRLGHRIGVRELVDLEGALSLASDDGAKIKATLIARAATLRSARVADVEADADKATESMKFALIVMVFTFLTYELYPSVARLFAG